ncbi:hypothetical protein QRD40_05645 [Comamonas sp. Y6]|nr:hypothetical protein [Comamonas resistens]MDL5035830.1 hypothetical protein [Comamonas resistens]
MAGYTVLVGIVTCWIPGLMLLMEKWGTR